MKIYLTILTIITILMVSLPILDITHMDTGKQYRPRSMGKFTSYDLTVIDSQLLTYQYKYNDGEDGGSIYGSHKMGCFMYYKEIK